MGAQGVTWEGTRVDRRGKAHNDRNPEHHVRHIARLAHPKGIDQLSQGTAKRIRQRRQRRGTNSAPVREPQIRISRRRSEHKWL